MAKNRGSSMRKFDTKVQHLKYKVLREVARFAWEDTLYEKLTDIPEMISPGPEATMRCCVYKERAILSKRIKLALGGDKENPNVIEVITIACDECPMGGYEVTNACRGCLAHRCEDVCKFGAITFDSQQKAHIDKTKCKECGACAKVCPYSAITHHKRPCQNACKVKAITMDERNAAAIDINKCIECGACVYQCPFGAISDKSFIVDTINIIKNSENHTKYNVYAIVAPAISSQFVYAELGQVIAGIKKLGFNKVLETAFGADLVSRDETNELIEKGFLTSSCCPAFVKHVNQAFPEMAENVSHNPSPMVALAKYIKERDKAAKVIFIGPCTAKKGEMRKESAKPYVDSVITFEELQALFDSRDIDVTSLKEETLDNASYYGRIFARCGGLSEAVNEILKEQGSDFELKGVVCDGIEECRTTLLKKSKNIIDVNFIEGMACTGGCIGGAGCLTHNIRDRIQIDKYADKASSNIEETIRNFSID